MSQVEETMEIMAFTESDEIFCLRVREMSVGNSMAAGRREQIWALIRAENGTAKDRPRDNGN